MDVKTLETLHSLASENNSESSGRTTEPSHGLRKDSCMATIIKPASIKQGSPSKPSSAVAVDAVIANGPQQKESPPQKKLRGHSDNVDVSNSTEVPVWHVMAKGLKRTASSEGETPSKRKRAENHITDTSTSEATKVVVTGASTSRQISLPYSVKTSRADFEARYVQLNMLGEGGFGSVYAGNRKIDNLAVAIKHIPQEHVDRHPMVLNGNLYRIPTEVLLMMKTTGGGTSAAVHLLDWYDLDEEVLLVMERPVPSLDLLSYLNDNNGPLKEGMAKDIMKQLVDAAIIMHSVGVFHRDLKPENILIQIGSDVPRVWVIDLGCGCIIKKKTYHRFSGTSAYIPPEFYKHGIYRAEPTTVWQLGAIMFEMLDGYEQFNTTEFIQNEMKVNKELSQDCQDLLKACLALNPEERVTLKEMQLHPWLTILNPTQP